MKLVFSGFGFQVRIHLRMVYGLWGYKSSVTRWLDYLSYFATYNSSNLPKIHKKCQRRFKILPKHKPSKVCLKFLKVAKFCLIWSHLIWKRATRNVARNDMIVDVGISCRFKCLKMDQTRLLFVHFHMTNIAQMINACMACLGLELRAGGW